MDYIKKVFFNKLDSLYPLPNEEKELLFSKTHPLKLKKNEYFIRAGDFEHRIGFMVNGLIKYFYICPDGADYIRYFCQGNQFVSAYSSLATGDSSAYFIQCLEDTTMVYFEYSVLNELISANPVYGVIISKIQEYSLLLAEKRERSLILDDAKTRYMDFLKDFPGMEKNFKQYDIASYLGITPVALSRIRGKKL